MISTLTSSPTNQKWHWHDFLIRYQQAGHQGPPIVLIHGFGASSDHWRHNISVLGQHHRVYALDLIGFGRSAKPEPGDPCGNAPFTGGNAPFTGGNGEAALQSSIQIPYNFDTWGTQVSDFLRDVVREPAFLVGNSIGGVVALQAAVNTPDQSLGVILLDCALRQIHDRKVSSQPLARRLGRPLLKQILKNKPLVHWLFRKLAQPGVIRKVLQQAYGNKAAVTDELVELLLQPAQDPGAADVFWAFINNFTGALPEDLLPQLTCPALILWGTADPWEPIALGRQLAQYPAVEEFIPLEGVGHCPQDEAPEQVNPLIQSWIGRHAIASAVS